MDQPKPIAIVGGGLAGLTLGIGLRERSVPVAIYEAGKYPRHRVCGEFISGRGQEVLTRLGLQEALRAAGSMPAETAAFFFGRSSSPPRRLTPPAWSIARFALDALLAREFRLRGGDLRENTRWPGPASTEGVVLANGRRAQSAEHGWRWFGLKVHARKVRLRADLEMHSFDNGYMGLSRLAGGEVNICGLFRRRVGARSLVANWRELLRDSAAESARELLAEAEFDEASFCAVAGLPLRTQRARGRSECCIGDALTMIPPVTGNGMSMAFEAAALAMEPLAAYSRGDCSWGEAQDAVAQACDKSFARRLAWARWLQRLMFSPVLRSPAGGVLLRSEWLWKVMFDSTR